MSPNIKVAYWPGCVSRGFTPELHGSMALTADALGIEMVTLDRASCCGAGVIAEHNQELADSLNARTFALAQQTDLPMMNICSTCQGAQSECQQRLDADSAYRAHINEVLGQEGLSYEKDKDGWENKNFLWVLVEDYGLTNEAISIFGQLDFEVTDRLTLTGGLNYTHDKKRFSANAVSSDVFAGIDFNNPAYAFFRYQLLLGGALQMGLPPEMAQAFAAANQNNPFANPLNPLRPLQIFPPFLGVPNTVEPGRTRDDNVSWTIRASYDVTDEVRVYAGVAKGFKASSVNLSRDSRPPLAAAAAITSAGLAEVNQTYGSRFAGPEKATVFEAGVKADWGMAGANLAIFEQDIRGHEFPLRHACPRQAA